jgi:hypothetical protein
MAIIETKDNAALRIEKSHKREVKSAITSTLVLASDAVVKNGMLLKEGVAVNTYELADESTATAILNYVPHLENAMADDEVELVAGSYEVSVALSGFCRMVDLGSEADNWTAYSRLRQFGIQAEVLGAIYNG